jgi:hypothetical protein
MATITLPLGIPLPLPGPHNVCLPAHFVPDYLGLVMACGRSMRCRTIILQW